jgi:hypothetical protein
LQCRFHLYSLPVTQLLTGFEMQSISFNAKSHGTAIHPSSGSPRWLAGVLLGLLLPSLGQTQTGTANPNSAGGKSAPAARTGGDALPRALAGTWRQICQPYIPGDGASDITYVISMQGTDKLKLEGVAKDYKNISCAGGGTVIATPVFEQKLAGSGTVGGVPVVKLVDADASGPVPPDAKSVIGIDKGQLRMGKANGARDGSGFPSEFEKPAEAYNKL